MSVYLRGENWYIDFVFKRKRVRESIGPSRKDAEKVIAKKKTEIVENKYLDIRKEPEPIRFHDFAKDYLQWSKANKKSSTHKREVSFMRQLEREFEKGTIQEITTWQIEKWKIRRKGEIKPASVNRELGLLKSMFSKAIEWGKIKESPAKKVKFLKVNNNRLRYLMPEEIQNLLSNCAEHLKPIVTVAVHTGMRKGELLSLKWDQVNFEQGVITLLETKNNERRDIPTDDTVKTTLNQLERKGPYVFCGNDGLPFKYVDESFTAAVRRSGIEDFHFHDLRHTFASNLVMQEGVELNDVRELLGHKNISMTLRYAHLSPKHKTRVVNLLDRVLSQNPPQSEEAKKVVSLRP